MNMSKEYDFDEILERRGSGALKVDSLKKYFGCDDLIPMWVADMDFRTPDFIVESLKNRVQHEIFGYPTIPQGYYPSIVNWLKRKHGWEISPDFLSFIPGVVKGFTFAILHFTKPGEKVIIQPPVYSPFHSVPRMQGRNLLLNPLKLDNGVYQMDLEHLRKNIDKDCTMMILCNPHNPIGITWDRETLKELAEICYENNVLVVSDEIHSDMAIFGNKHIPFATVSDEAKENSITLMAPSKTFNMAGLVSSFAIVPDGKIRKSFFDFLIACELNNAHIFAPVATQAAYEEGDEWLRQMLQYLEKNILFIDEYLKKNIPQIKAFIPQASFLIWLDCRALGLSQEALVDFFINKAKLALNSGAMFGDEGLGFMRMNIACAKQTIETALGNLNNSVRGTR